MLHQSDWVAVTAAVVAALRSTGVERFDIEGIMAQKRNAQYQSGGLAGLKREAIGLQLGCQGSKLDGNRMVEFKFCLLNCKYNFAPVGRPMILISPGALLVEELQGPYYPSLRVTNFHFA